MNNLNKTPMTTKPPSIYPHPKDLATAAGIKRVQAWFAAHLEHLELVNPDDTPSLAEASRAARVAPLDAEVTATHRAYSAAYMRVQAMKGVAGGSDPEVLRLCREHQEAIAAWRAVVHEPRTDDLQVGPMRIRNTKVAISQMAKNIAKNWRLANKKADLPAELGKPSTELYDVDAVRVAGNYQDAAALIRSQLARQSGSMDPADVKRCEAMAERLYPARRL